MNAKLLLIMIFIFSLSGCDTETRIREKEVGFQGYAAINDLLAAQRYLESLGETVLSRRNLVRVEKNLSPNDVLLIAERSDKIRLSEIDKLLAWVKRGGKLIVGASADFKTKDKLLTKLRISESKKKKAGERVIQYFAYKKKLKVKFTSERRFSYRGPWSQKSISDEHGDLITRLRYGKGEIVLLSDISMFHNKRIAKLDHAALFNLVTLRNGVAKYWLIYSGNAATLTQLIIEYLWAFLIALAVLMLLWLLNSYQRFGPIISSVNSSRRSLQEHIKASGRLLWEYNEREDLVEVTRKRLYSRITLRNPLWLQESEHNLINNLSQATSIPVDKVRFAIKNNSVKKEISFTQTIRILEKIRKAL